MSNTLRKLSQIQRLLLNITVSSAPDALKSIARVQLERLAGGKSVDTDASATDELAHAISELPGSLACHVDLMRLLHGGSAQHRQHRRVNMTAILRDKTRRLGRAPVEADFPVHHPIHAFALAYWGGVAAWSAGSVKRAQHAKGFWLCRSNQIIELQSAVARHPGVPVTHALLQVAGLHRLAAILVGKQLALLADEAGVDRALSYKVGGWWTAERVIDAYAKECRAVGATLSSSALTAIGGEASSLRVYATRHFGSFRAFQAAVISRHPDIRRPERPVAADGTPLDSWSEVVAYNAMRIALPDARIKAHVVLPGEPARWPRSGDFVIDGRIWVEVLRLSHDEIKTAATKHQMKYAKQWIAKLARYTALNLKLVVIEPADIHDPQRLAERIGEIARQLGVEPPSVPPPSIRHIRSKGTWSFDALCNAVREVAGTSGTLPTYAMLSAAGYGHAAQLLRRPGRRQSVATAIGLRDENRKDVWTRTRVVEELAAAVGKYSKFPTRVELRRAGCGRLCSAADRLWAGDLAGLRAAVEKVTGTPLPPRRAANGSLTTQLQLLAALKPLADKLGRMPSCKEANAAGLSTAWACASRSIGVRAMARLLDVRCVGPQRRSRAEMLQEFCHLAASVGIEPLTTTMIKDAMGAGGLARLRKCGGIASVRAEIGQLSRRNGRAV